MTLKCKSLLPRSFKKRITYTYLYIVPSQYAFVYTFSFHYPRIHLQYRRTKAKNKVDRNETVIILHG